MPKVGLSPFARRIVYAALFESTGLFISTLGLVAFSRSDTFTAATAAFGAMTIALAYNYAFNTAFEAWERRQPIRGRPARVRILHGVLFEGGLVLLMVPFLAWWMQVGLIAAFLYDAGLIAFFAVYTMLFTWGFDRVFGLPASAR